MSGFFPVLGSMEDQEGPENLFLFNFISCDIAASYRRIIEVETFAVPSSYTH